MNIFSQGWFTSTVFRTIISLGKRSDTLLITGLPDQRLQTKQLAFSLVDFRIPGLEPRKAEYKIIRHHRYTKGIRFFKRHQIFNIYRRDCHFPTILRRHHQCSQPSRPTDGDGSAARDLARTDGTAPRPSVPS